MYTQEEAKQIRKKFWDTFGQRCEIVPELQWKKKKWILYNTKISGLDLKFEVDREYAMVMIEVNNRDEDKRLKIYELLDQYKTFIEDGFEDSLNWNFFYTRESGQQVCRIYTEMKGADIHRQNQWPDIYNFMIKNMLLLENNFLEIRDIIKEQL